jgi:hypothetical protein
MGVEPPAKELAAVPRFILIEPSIEGHIGHHLEYAVHVLRAAAEAGYQPLLATNRRFPAESDAPFDTYRQYKYSFWSQPLISGLGPMKWLYRRLRRSTSSCATAVSAVSDATAVPAVRGATGVPPVLYEEHEQDARATQHGQDARTTGLLRRAAGCWRRWLADPIRVRQFARDTESLIRQLDLRADDLLFLPGAGEIELEGLTRLLAHCKDAARATWHLVFRRDPPSPAAPNGAHARLLRALRRVEPDCRAGRVRFYTDTEELSREYEKLAHGLHVGQVANLPLDARQVGNLPHEAIRFRTLPIPHTDSGPVEPCGSSEPLHVLYLGDARREKGYHHLPQIVADLWDDCIAGGRIVLTIQSNPALTDDEPQIAAAREQLRSYASTAITLLEEPLSSSAYRRLLHSGGLILLPYDRPAYRWRSSGILVEALAAGIPPVVPADTWLARQLPHETLGAAYNDVREIPAIIRRIIADYGRYRQAALAFAAGWRSKHNAASLVAMLASGDWD